MERNAEHPTSRARVVLKGFAQWLGYVEHPLRR